MNARSIRSGHTLVWRLILVSILLLPWPAMAEDEAALPLSKIVLYSSGVGYFQHDGTVNNRTQLDLRFNVSQINDMLKSLVVQDFGGGKVSTVTYGSRDPVTKTLGSFVSIPDGSAFFSGDPAAPFRPDAPLSRRYQDYLIEWITGQDIGQGVTWHSTFQLTAETFRSFEGKALSIMQEHLLAVRLRAMGCRVTDVTWLATALKNGGASAVRWSTPWQEQLANRDQAALAV